MAICYYGGKNIWAKVTVTLCVILCLNIPYPADATSSAVQYSVVELLTNDVELTASCYLTKGKSVVVQLPSVYAPLEEQNEYAKDLAQQGQSTCFSHVFSDLFLSLENNNYQNIPPQAFHQFLIKIAEATNKTVYLATHGRGARVAMRIASLAKTSVHPTPVALIMFSPNLLDGSPDAGKEHQYIKQVSQTSLPIFILQSVYSPHVWHLDKLREKFTQANTPVIIEKLPNVRDGYALREDQTSAEVSLRRQTGKLLQSAILKLENR